MGKINSQFSGMVHCVNGQTVFASKGNQIHVSYDNGNHWSFLFSIPLPLFLRFRSLAKLTRRLFRDGIHHIVCLGKHTLVLVAYSSIYTYNLKDKRLNPEVTRIFGSRPLVLCKDSDDLLYYGIYSGNSKRSPVHLLCSDDGGHQWKPIYQFKGIRHVHGVCNDPYDKKLWVTTGDTNEEAGIWMTDDGFHTIEKVVGGTQQTRAIQLLFTKEHVYFGSDTPIEKNHIYRMDKKTGLVYKIQEVQSSVFWGSKVGNALFFSTAVERSKVNRCQDANIWGSIDGENWKCLAGFRKDIWPMKYFQYGQVFFRQEKILLDISGLPLLQLKII